ncbi:unnamed protein product [Arctia plantaginis]|uniref:Uncharacterized protein n=1 Tax=Arctia plantaginis TaxID=874455 RepID=A0A8S1ALD3_ARCPL|nr:unnamed protein product [Arctia plantaginis]
MRLPLRCSYYLFLTLVLKSNAAVIQNNVEEDLRVRVRRQDGYVYNKPNISFDLPSQSTIESTQAPTVDRILEQQMYYAYPAPAGGDAINIGSTTGPIISTTAAAPVSEGSSSGYNYQSSTGGSGGYKYETPVPGPTETQANIAPQVSNTASQTILSSTASVTNSNSKANSEYNYKAPSPTLSQTYQSSSEVSTSAPRYLPPVGGSASISLGGEGKINIGSGSAASGAGPLIGSNIATQTGSNSVGTLSENYLPPLINNVVSTSETPASITINTQTNSRGSISVPSTAYLPPKSSLSSTPLQALGLTNTSQNAASAKEYIPPTNTEKTSGTVATPTSGYLPPRFF